MFTSAFGFFPNFISKEVLSLSARTYKSVQLYSIIHFQNRTMLSRTWTGSRIVLCCSVTAREHAWRIHQCEYVESLKPFAGSNFSMALIRPTMPSCTRSSKTIPLPVYFFATLMTKRKLCSISTFFAVRESFIADETSCSDYTYVCQIYYILGIHIELPVQKFQLNVAGQPLH